MFRDFFFFLFLLQELSAAIQILISYPALASR